MLGVDGPVYLFQLTCVFVFSDREGEEVRLKMNGKMGAKIASNDTLFC